MITKQGHELEADAVVIGAGVGPDVMLARGAGVELGDSGGIRVDTKLETGRPGVFAAGDVAEYESVIHGGRRIRVEHWDVAFNQGKTAALNMLGRGLNYDVVPYFFSDLSDWAAIEYVGPGLRMGSRGGPRLARRWRVHGLLPRGRSCRRRPDRRTLGGPRTRPALDRGGY